MDTRTPTEEQVAKSWRELLELDTVTIDETSSSWAPSPRSPRNWIASARPTPRRPVPVFEGEM